MATGPADTSWGPTRQKQPPLFVVVDIMWLIGTLSTWGYDARFGYMPSDLHWTVSRSRTDSHTSAPANALFVTAASCPLGR